MLTATVYHCPKLNADVRVSVDRLYLNGFPMGTVYFQCDGAERCQVDTSRPLPVGRSDLRQCVHPDRPAPCC